MSEKCLAEIMIEVLPQTMGWLRSKVSENSEPDLTLPQFRILKNIDNGLTSVTKIAKHQGVTQPAMSQMVDVLIQKKLIHKKINPVDKRQIVLSLSKKGKCKLDEIICLVKKDVASQFEDLSQAKKTKIIEALLLLNEHIGDYQCSSLS